MNNADLANQLVGKYDTSTNKGAKAFVDAVFDEVAAAVIGGQEVSLAGFGKFKLKSVEERQGRNPKTGESITIAASKKVAFSASSTLKSQANA